MSSSGRRLLRASLIGLSATVAAVAAATAQAANSPAQITVTGAPRGFVVVSVPVPAEMTAAQSATYSVEVAATVSLIGRAGGPVPDAGRNVLFTLGISGQAQAGPMTAAQVSFTAGSQTVRVPVTVDVSAVYGITLATRDLTSVPIGTRISLPITVHNAGNTPDTVRVRLTLPRGWHHQESQFEAPAVLGPGGRVEKVARISVPRSSATGDFFLQIEAVTGNARATGTAAVEVLDGLAGSMNGPSFQASVAAVAGGGAERASVFSAALNGPVTSSIQVDGRIALATSREPVATRGFSRVEAFATTPWISVASPSWRVSAGNTAVGYSELTGVNAWGTALAGSYAYRNQTIRALAAPGLNSGSGAELFGASYMARHGDFTMTSSAMRLAENAYQPRSLTAAAFGLGVDSLPIGALSAEVAYRDFERGSGLGWLGEFRNDQRNGRVQVRYLHAPGGSAAFARARDEITATVTRTILPRWEVSGSFLSASDSNATLPSMNSRTIAFNQQFRLDPAVTLNLDARSTNFSAAAADTTSFGSNEQRLTGGVIVRRGVLNYAAEAGIESMERDTKLGLDLRSSLGGQRAIMRGTTELITSNGVLQAEAGYERSLAATLLPSLFTVAARAGQVRVFLPPGDVFFNGEALYQTWGVSRSSSVILRGGVTVPLPNAFEISAHTEYNTFFESAATRSPLVFSLKLERSLNLPRLRLSSQSGYVFHDLNNNGIRELDEPGVNSVVVRQGTARAVTGRDGRYDFWDRARGDFALDASTLPVGFVPGQRSAPALTPDLPVVSTAPVQVTLAANLENSRNAATDLERIIVLARDQQGREWVARRTGRTTFVFDALPPGDYELRADFSAMPDPLRVAVPVTFRVDGRSTVRLTVPLVSRPIRMFQAPSAAPGRGVGNDSTSVKR